MAPDLNNPAQPQEPIRKNPDPNARAHIRGWREGDEEAESIMPGREYGAGGGVDDGPDETAEAGTDRG